jgi:hypothetical protein
MRSRQKLLYSRLKSDSFSLRQHKSMYCYHQSGYSLGNAISSNLLQFTERRKLACLSLDSRIRKCCSPFWIYFSKEFFLLGSSETASTNTEIT